MEGRSGRNAQPRPLRPRSHGADRGGEQFPREQPPPGHVAFGHVSRAERRGAELHVGRPESSLREDAECIGDVFSAAGYDCAYIGKLHADFPTKNNPQRPGTYVSDAVPEWDAYTPPERRHGFNYWYSYGTYDVHKHPHYWDTDGNRHDVDEWSPRHEVSKAIEYIENKGGVRDPEKPFLMMIGMNPPHSPYASTDDCDLEGYERYKDKSLTELLVRDNADTTMAKAAAVRYYFANVSGIDREFGRLLAALDKAGLTENTIVVFASGPRRDDDQPFDRRPQELDLARVAEHSLSGALSGAGAAPCGRSAALDARHHADAAGAGGPRGAGSRECRGCDYSAVLRQDAVQPERPRAALYMRNLDGGRDADGLVRGFFAQARGVKTATHTMELRIGRDGTLERVLMFDDAADPYQLHNLAPEEHPALFAALCRELAVLLRDNDDVWFREGVLSDVVPYDTNN